MSLKHQLTEIWKFPLKPLDPLPAWEKGTEQPKIYPDSQIIEVPGHWQPYSAEERFGVLCLFMGVDPKAPKVKLHIRVVETGQVAEDLEKLTFVGTAKSAELMGMSCLWHVFIDQYGK